MPIVIFVSQWFVIAGLRFAINIFFEEMVLVIGLLNFVMWTSIDWAVWEFHVIWNCKVLIHYFVDVISIWRDIKRLHYMLRLDQFTCLDIQHSRSFRYQSRVINWSCLSHIHGCIQSAEIFSCHRNLVRVS